MLLLNMLVYAVVASFTPGPNNIMALFFSQNLTFKKAFRFSLGVGLSFLSLLCLSNIFNESLNTVFPKIEIYMKIFAFIYLLYLAYKVLISSIGGPKKSFDEKYSNIKYAMILQFINPKGVIYALTVISTFVTLNYSNWIVQLNLVILLAFIGFLGTLSWAAIGTLLKEWITKHELLFNIIMSCLLIYVAFSIVLH
ncbi:LysE family transporter [Staphylococcus saprophyticus]|nr:LysE family transporter [Staphylococcus saprophyticus]